MDLKNKKTMVLLLILILSVLGASYYLFFNEQEAVTEKAFPLENDLLVGNELGTISLLNAKYKTIHDSLNLTDKNLTVSLPSKETEKEIVENVSNKTNDDKNTEEKQEKENTKTVETEESKKVLNRNINVVGTDDITGHKLVEIPIISGDWWIRVQKVFLPNESVNNMITNGSRINNHTLHPIYPGDIRVFLVPNEFFGDSKVEEEPVEETKDEKEKEDLEDGEVETQSNLENLRFDGDYKNFVYNFKDKNFVFDNLKSNLYEVIKEDKSLDLVKVYDFENLKIDRFEVYGGVLFFTTNEDSNIYAYDNKNLLKISADKNITDWSVGSNNVYYTANEGLYSVDFTTGDKNSLYLGDISTDVYVDESGVYVANKFGATISKSVIHRLDHNLASYGWAEIGYSVNTEILGITDNGKLIAKQSLQGEKDKITIVNNDLSLDFEVGFPKIHKTLNTLGEKHFYGVDKGVLSLYDIQGRLIDAIDLQASTIKIIK